MGRTDHTGRRGKHEADGKAARLSDFLKEAGPHEIHPIYILRGTDPYLLDQGRQALRRLVLGDADPGLALAEYQGPEAVLADVLDTLRTLPFLAPRRLVTLREADEFVGDEDNREALLKYLEAPAPTGTLCLEVKTWNPTTRLAKRVAEIGRAVLCEAAEPALIPRWLQNQAKTRYGKALTYGAAQMLAEYLGADFAALLSALETLALYVGDSPSIDETAVDALIARGHHETVWELSGAAAARNPARALALLDAFWADGMEAPQLVGLLRSEFRSLLRVKALSRRMSVDAAVSQAKVPWPAQARIRAAVPAFSDAHLADAYQALVDADLDAKSGADPRLAMETLIHRLCDPQMARGARTRIGGLSD